MTFSVLSRLGACGVIGRTRHAALACKRDNSGASAVEMALGLPFVLLAILGAIEAGSVVYSQAELGYALSRTTRYSMVMESATGTQIAARLREQFVLLDPSKLNSVDVVEIANADTTRTATVTVAYRHTFMLPLLPVDYVMLHRSQTFLRSG